MKISPSILNADFSCLQKEIDSIASADRIHLDVMDGHYVSNITFGASIFKKITFPVETEVHLMVEYPEAYFDVFCELGVGGIIFHAEVVDFEDTVEFIENLKDRGVRTGICIDGDTEPGMLSDEILEVVDQILVMSVQAGKGGQKFMPESLEKIRSLRERGFEGEIEVDGGINLENAVELREAGADIVVVGSFLMKKPAEERAELIQKFQSI